VSIFFFYYSYSQRPKRSIWVHNNWSHSSETPAPRRRRHASASVIGWMGYSALSSGRTRYKRTPHHRGSQLAAGEIIKPALNRLSRRQIGRRQGGGRVPGLRPMAAPVCGRNYILYGAWSSCCLSALMTRRGQVTSGGN